MPDLFPGEKFVVHHRPALIEQRIGYDVSDPDGALLATIEQVGRDNVARTFRPSKDDATTTQFEVRDASSSVVLLLTHERALKSSLRVADANGADIGSIQRDNLIGKARFVFNAGGARVATMSAQSLRNKNFVVATVDGAEAARIDMTHGSSGDHAHDNCYAMHLDQPLADPLRLLAFAAVIAVDLVLWER